MKIITNPKDIEKKSFQIVDEHLINIKLPKLQKEILKRIVHATSDLNYAKDIVFHKKAVKNGLSAIKKRKNIIADSRMVKAGINKKILSNYGGKVICLIDNPDIAKNAYKLNITRAMLAMRKACKLMDDGIVVIGNAPTALFEICDLIDKGRIRPALVIGLPVGFVGAKEAKKKLRSLNIPFITNRSRRGGSSAAASCVNALLKLFEKRFILAGFIFLCLIFFTSNAFAMHISEGILPLKYAAIWYLAAIPFLIKGIFDIKKKTNTIPGFKPLLGLMGALVFVISCMPVPVPTAGTCSHPAGTGISAILIGPIMSIFVTSIALIIQALFLAHGGITTWGADIVSMGIAGSFTAYFSFRILRKFKASLFISGFIAGLLADWATYITTSFELAQGLHGAKPILPLFYAILTAFIPTQLPLGILEGFLTGGMIVFVCKKRPDIMVSLGVIK